MTTLQFDIEGPTSSALAALRYVADHLPIQTEQEDSGIGAYEYWGATGYDSRPYWTIKEISGDLVVRFQLPDSDTRVIPALRLPVEYDGMHSKVQFVLQSAQIHRLSGSGFQVEAHYGYQFSDL